ncbi:helicase [Providencia heimbachae]|uniref:DnaB-like helicase C-terminal domain-containing protein n=1 Tax=Providencia heimbachae TaxID=333962 RepID=UPI0010BE4003|nr:DnaB-like helicase C-terminal domain-containing protein [Providencia heimbachae]QCJ70891.1 helicase [Providencia heimbachae]
MTVNNFKQVPHSIETEQSVIGALLIDPSSDNSQKVFSVLRPEDFYNHNHKIIFSEMRSMASKHQAIDILTVSSNLEASGLDANTGGFAYIAEIANGTPSAANVVAYAKKLREHSASRYAIDKINEATRLLIEPSTLTFTEKMEFVQKLVTDATENGVTGRKSGLKNMAELLPVWFEGVENRFNNPEQFVGLKTGIKPLDDMLSPKFVVRGSLFVIGARPKMGKTTVLTELAKNVSNDGLAVALFSMEMTNDQIIERVVSQKTGLNSDMFYGGTDDAFEWGLLGQAMSDLSDNPNTWVDDTPNMTIEHIQSECRKLKRKVGRIGFIGVDYLTLMRAGKADRNDLAYGDITKGLKQLAKELDTVVVLLTQLNRKLEDRPNKRPLPSDSRDTSQIEQDCDYWMGIHKESVYTEGADKTLTELLVRLNRHGKTGTAFVDQKGLCLFDTDQIQAMARSQPVNSRNTPNHKDF